MHKIVTKKGTSPSVVIEISAYRQKLDEEFLN
jgi:hypothetical protein